MESNAIYMNPKWKRGRYGGKKAAARRAAKRRTRSGIRPMGTGSLVCRRYYEPTAIAGSDSTPQGGLAYTFKLNDLTNVAEFTSLFAAYKITGVAYRWVLKTNPDITATTFKGQNVRVLFANDHNDATIPTSDNTLKEFGNCQEVWLSSAKPASRWYFQRPRVEIANIGQMRTWIDTGGAPGQPHYGLKAYWTNMFAGVYLVPEFRYYLAFKQVK